MIRKYVLPVIAFAGVLFALYMVKRGNAHVPPAAPVAEPAVSKFKYSVAGAGLVEASTENIAVGTLLPGVVSDVVVQVNQPVKKGEPLFKLDEREARAELKAREAMLASAQAQLQKLLNQPRPEEIPVAEAKVAEAEARLENAKLTLSRWERVEDAKAVSPDELRTARLNAKVADANAKAAQADLALLKAGAWKPDVDIARAQLAAAEAQVNTAKTNLERLTVTAPVDGTVLQVKVRVGEFAQVGPLATPLMILGRTERLHIRVDVDENEAPRVVAGAEAEASIRGNSELKAPVQFVRIEPYIVPKRSLTGDSTERVDTRVLQVIYSFDPKALPARVGQQMDVFIKADAPGATQPATQTARASE
jgi:multidrug efflux pump subunit AcrA (membrane-fusion protein)